MLKNNTKDKFQYLKHEIENSEYLLVHLNPSAKGVCVPKNYLNQPTLTLKISSAHNTELSIDPERIIAELIFNGYLSKCTIPLESVWGCTTVQNENIVWPEDLAPETLLSIAGQINLSVQQPQESTIKGNNLSVITNKTEDAEEKKSEKTSKKNKPNLKLIK